LEKHSTGFVQCGVPKNGHEPLGNMILFSPWDFGRTISSWSWQSLLRDHSWSVVSRSACRKSRSIAAVSWCETVDAAHPHPVPALESEDFVDMVTWCGSTDCRPLQSASISSTIEHLPFVEDFPAEDSGFLLPQSLAKSYSFCWEESSHAGEIPSKRVHMM